MNLINFGGTSVYVACWFVVFVIWVAWNFFNKKRKMSFLDVELYLFYFLVVFLIGLAIFLLFNQ